MRDEELSPVLTGPLAPERRSEPRLSTTDAAQVMVLDDAPFQLEALVMNVSRSGLRIVVRVRIAVGTCLRVSFRRPLVILGEVRYCRSMNDLYHTGVQIHDVQL